MVSAAQSVSNNIKVLMDNSRPRASQTVIARLINLKQPQVSLRLNGRHPWGIDELETIADFFGVPITLLVDPDPAAIYRWLVEHGTIDLRDLPTPTCSWSVGTGSYDLRLFDPDQPSRVVEMKDHRMGEISQNEPSDLLAVGF